MPTNLLTAEMCVNSIERALIQLRLWQAGWLLSKWRTLSALVSLRYYLYRFFNDNDYPLTLIKRTLRQQQLPIPKGTTAETPQPTWRLLPYVQGVSELIARHLRPYNLTIAVGSEYARGEGYAYEQEVCVLKGFLVIYLRNGKMMY